MLQWNGVLARARPSILLRDRAARGIRNRLPDPIRRFNGRLS
ncbi:hypothetical protein C7S15_3553 [Burkholderia cepacia]|nr:hypothetical protein [Burkholderia cepacia]